MRPVDQAKAIAQQFRSQSNAQSFLGLVSPCSTCNNQRSVPGPNGEPPCPRRTQAVIQQQLETNGRDASNLNLVTLTGNGNQDDGTQPLTNPIYDDSTHSILVWGATFKDNTPRVDANGVLLSPSILDPSFDTNWIVCRPLPFTPKDSEAQYFQKGALMEGDQIEIQVSPVQQVTAQASGDADPLLVDGTVTKVNVFSFFPRQPLTKDLCPPGT